MWRPPESSIEMAPDRSMGINRKRMTAGNVMRPRPAILAADEPAHRGLSLMERQGCDLLVTVEMDEVVGVLRRDALRKAICSRPGASTEMIGNLATGGFRLCREGDSLECVARRLATAEVGVMVVSDEDGTVVGIVLGEEIP